MSNKLLLISNMYPSAEDTSYGVFVKNFEQQVESQGLKIADKVVIAGKGRNSFNKIRKYISFYYNIIYKGLTVQYDIIYAHYLTHCALPLLILKLFSSKPLVLNAHGDDVMATTATQKILQFLAKPLVVKSDMLVVPSNFFSNQVQRIFGISASKIFVSPSGGVDTSLFEKLPVKRSDKFVIGYMSRIEKGKGWRVFLKAVSKFKSDIQDPENLRIIVIGDGTEKQTMLEEVERLELKSNITIKGRLKQVNLPLALNELDLMIFPTLLHESLGLAGLEAMSCGVPVIGSRIGGLSDYIEDNDNGFLFEPGNEHELYKKICLYYNLPEKEKERLQFNARKTALKFDSALVAADINRKLNSLAHR